MNEHMEHHANGTVTGFVLGALVGAGVALLLAPAAGTETRRRLGQTVRQMKTEGAEALDHAAQEARHAFHDIKENVSHGVQKVREGAREVASGLEGDSAGSARSPIPRRES